LKELMSSETTLRVPSAAEHSWPAAEVAGRVPCCQQTLR
jgi:hypothetical protein